MYSTNSLCEIDCYSSYTTHIMEYAPYSHLSNVTILKTIDGILWEVTRSLRKTNFRDV